MFSKYIKIIKCFLLCFLRASIAEKIHNTRYSHSPYEHQTNHFTVSHKMSENM